MFFNHDMVIPADECRLWAGRNWHLLLLTNAIIQICSLVMRTNCMHLPDSCVHKRLVFWTETGSPATFFAGRLHNNRYVINILGKYVKNI